MTAPFTPADHLADVLARYEDSPDARLAELTTAAIRHLHAFVTEVGLTRDEWFAIIQGLTRTGQISDDQRQEFILASDTLGVSMLVEMINHQAEPGSTEPTVFGPFHVEGAPERAMGASIVDDAGPSADATGADGGEAVTFSGRVLDLDGNPIAGAVLDVWSTAANGLYDVQDDGQSSMNMRGRFTTDADGRYEFVGVRPPAYSIPGDGPAGELLFANGRHNWRPGHLHVMAIADGYQTLITHVFDAASDYLDSDAVFGVRPSLILDMSGGTCHLDIVLQRPR